MWPIERLRNKTGLCADFQNAAEICFQLYVAVFAVVHFGISLFIYLTVEIMIWDCLSASFIHSLVECVVRPWRVRDMQQKTIMLRVIRPLSFRLSSVDRVVCLPVSSNTVSAIVAQHFHVSRAQNIRYDTIRYDIRLLKPLYCSNGWNAAFAVNSLSVLAHPWSAHTFCCFLTFSAVDFYAYFIDRLTLNRMTTCKAASCLRYRAAAVSIRCKFCPCRLFFFIRIIRTIRYWYTISDQ